MPLELQIIKAREFVRLNPRQEFDLPASKAALAALAAACRKRNIDQAMLDLRELQPGPTPVFSPSDLSELVNTFHEMGFRMEQRLAVLYSADPHRRARLFAFIGTLKGWNVGAFESFEDALLWLAGEETIDLASVGDAKPIKIKGKPHEGAPLN